MSAETWVNILYTYGPFAVLILLICVVEKLLRNRKREAPPDEKRGLVWLYALNWLLIFVVVGISIFAWWRMNLTRRPEIRGTIENLSNRESLNTTSADLFLRRLPKSTALSDYEWVLVNRDKRFVEGTRIKFTIESPKPNSQEPDLYEYELPIRSSFYKKGVLLRHKPGKLFLDDNGQEKELSGGLLPGNTVPATASVQHSWELFPVAYAQAQGPTSLDDFVVGLQSPDIIVRRQARAELANQDQATALPWIDRVLGDQNCSYRLKLGVIVALNNMPGLRRESLSRTTVTAIQSALGESDQTLRSEAFSLASKYDLVPVTIYEHQDYSGRSQYFGAGKFRADRGQLGYLLNDSASSIHVIQGFRVRLCDNEGNGNGSGACEEYGPGWHAVRGVADQVSYIDVYSVLK